MPQEPARSSEKPPLPKVEGTMVDEQLNTKRIKPLYRTTQVIWYIIGVLEVFLFLRLMLKVLGANPNAGFSQFINGVTYVFAGPFMYVFGVSRVESSVFEWSTVLAMIVYVLFGWLIVKAIVMSRPVSTKEAERKLPEQEKI